MSSREALNRAKSFVQRAVVGQDGASIVELVSSGDTEDLGRRGLPVFEVPLFPRTPRRLLAKYVRAAAGGLDYAGDFRAELNADLCEASLAALILHRVVEQCGDCLVLVAAEMSHRLLNLAERGGSAS